MPSARGPVRLLNGEIAAIAPRCPHDGNVEYVSWLVVIRKSRERRPREHLPSELVDIGTVVPCPVLDAETFGLGMADRGRPEHERQTGPPDASRRLHFDRGAPGRTASPEPMGDKIRRSIPQRVAAPIPALNLHVFLQSDARRSTVWWLSAIGSKRMQEIARFTRERSGSSHPDGGSTFSATRTLRQESSRRSLLVRDRTTKRPLSEKGRRRAHRKLT